jgi:hypothetical protein
MSINELPPMSMNKNLFSMKEHLISMNAEGIAGGGLCG